MNKLQLSLILGFAMGILVVFGYFRTVFISMSHEAEARRIREAPTFIWPDTTTYND